MNPQRFQCMRKKGWKMPENAIYVGRPSKWGNPFKIDPPLTRGDVVKMFEDWLKEMPTDKRAELLRPLKDRDLVCWCPLDEQCHADVLLKWANR